MGLVESLPSVSFENDAEVHWYYYLANGIAVQQPERSDGLSATAGWAAELSQI